MIYDTGTVAIVSPSRSAGRDAILQYGVCDIFYPTDDQITVIPSILLVTTEAEAAALPAGTPWAVVDGASPLLIALMKARVGPPSRMPDVIRALNDEYAIDPRKLMLPPVT
jgi:hypothetical protein